MITRIHDEITLSEPTTGHEEHFFWSNLSHAYDYDPTDDGPECEAITRILAKHPLYVPGAERKAIQAGRYLEAAALVLFGKSFASLTEEHRTIIRDRVAKTLAVRGLA